MKSKNVLFLTQAAMIAALYVVLTMVANALGLANQAIQIRFSEALTILPYFTFAAVPGLFVGCVISNLLAGGVILDVIFGSIATLLGALGTYFLRGFVQSAVSGKAKKGSFGQTNFSPRKMLLAFPPIAANTVIVPFVLQYGYGSPASAFFFNAATVCLGEVLSCGVLGMLLLCLLEKYRRQIFGQTF